MDILKTAIERERSVANLARALNVRPSVVSNWNARGVPRGWQLALELKYGRAAPTAVVQAQAIEVGA